MHLRIEIQPLHRISDAEDRKNLSYLYLQYYPYYT